MTTTTTKTTAEFNVEGRRLMERRWSGKGDCFTRLVYVCHGFADHSGFFDRLASQLAANGMLVVGHDFFGHGGSEGDVRTVGSIDTFVRDTRHHLRLLAEEFPGLAFHGIGYSLGALVLHRLAAEPDSRLLSQLWISPCLQPLNVKVSASMARCVRRLARLAPRLPVPGAKFNAEDITRDAEAVKQLRSDRTIRQRRLTFRLMSMTLDAMLGTEVDELRTPLLVTVGTDDALADASKSSCFVEEARSKGRQASLMAFVDCKHQLHTDAPDFHLCVQKWLLSN